MCVCVCVCVCMCEREGETQQLSGCDDSISWQVWHWAAIWKVKEIQADEELPLPINASKERVVFVLSRVWGEHVSVAFTGARVSSSVCIRPAVDWTFVLVNYFLCVPNIYCRNTLFMSTIQHLRVKNLSSIPFTWTVLALGCFCLSAAECMSLLNPYCIRNSICSMHDVHKNVNLELK